MAIVLLSSSQHTVTVKVMTKTKVAPFYLRHGVVREDRQSSLPASYTLYNQ